MRVGFLGRILFILMAALIAVVASTIGLDRLAHPTFPRGMFKPFPRVVHAAGIIALVDGADAKRQQEIIVEANSPLLRVSIHDRAPPPGADDIAAPHLAARLREAIGPRQSGLEAFTDARMAKRSKTSGIEGALTKAVAPLANGRFLLIEWHDPPRIASMTLLGMPPGVWSGILGFGVAVLALVAMVREIRPLRRLTEAVRTFDGSRPLETLQAKGAPDIRHLIQAVRGMQERMSGLLAERSFMIGAISHDLRTYLTRMQLRAESIGDADVRDRMSSDLDDMTRLIDTSLAYARGTTSSQNRVAIDLNDLVATEVEEHDALGLPTKLNAVYAPDSIVVGDPVALRRVVCNILDNALKFAQSAITVRVASNGTYECVTIEDDGPGVPAEERASVFDPFHRVERSRSRATGGTGLGLAIARQIVEAHGGVIELGSAEPTGAAFIIRLPNARHTKPRGRRP